MDLRDLQPHASGSRREITGEIWPGPAVASTEAGAQDGRAADRVRTRLDVWVVALVLSGYLAGTLALAWTRLPQPDEGHFASAGYELAERGRLAMPMWTEWVSSLDRYMFVQMPLYYVQLAAWVELFGPDLRAIRVNSVLWGVVLVLAWYVIVRSVAQDRASGLLGLLLIGFNYDLMNTTSARYDAMCAALSAAGVAWYLAWRERHLLRAVVGANVCIAAALLTHPFGIIGGVGLALFALMLDWRRLSWRVVAAAAVPYVVAFGAWGAYVLQDLAAFKGQMAANSQGRMSDLSNPGRLLLEEFRERYVARFAGWRPDVPVLMRVKILFLLAYLAAGAACLLTPALRRRPRVLALVLWGVLTFVMIAIADSNRWYIYLLHAIPIYTAILAVWLGWIAQTWRRGAYLVAAAATGWILFSFGTVGLRVRLDDYGSLYLPTLAYLQANVRPGDLVMAGGEFGPGLGFATHVLDDPKFGYRNGRAPEWIVHDKLHEDRMQQWARTEPSLHRHVLEVLGAYELVLDNRQPYNYYRIYRRPASR